MPAAAPTVFDVQRQRAQQSAQSERQNQLDAMKRRTAQLGGGPGGALVKAEQQGQNDIQGRLQQTNEGINAQEQADLAQKAELEKNRQFAREERLGSQDFAGTQADLGRKFTTSERLGSQDFGAGQAQLGREFTTSERLGSQQYGTSERKAGQTYQTGERVAGQQFVAGQTEDAQAFATGERKAGQTFAKTEAEKARDATAALQKNQLKAQSDLQTAQQTWQGAENAAQRQQVKEQFNQTLKQQKKEFKLNYENQVAQIQEAARHNEISEGMAQQQINETKRQYNEDSKFNNASLAISTYINGKNLDMSPAEMERITKMLAATIGPEAAAALTEATTEEKREVDMNNAIAIDLADIDWGSIIGNPGGSININVGGGYSGGIGGFVPM